MPYVSWPTSKIRPTANPLQTAHALALPGCHRVEGIRLNRLKVDDLQGDAGAVQIELLAKTTGCYAVLVPQGLVDFDSPFPPLWVGLL